MSPFELRELLIEIKTTIASINKSIPVVDDSMLANSINKLEKSDNMILVGVLPSYGSDGQNVDNVRTTVVTQLMVLEKCDYSDLTEDEFWELYERTYQTMQSVKDMIVQKVSEDCPSYLINIDVNSLDIDPVWGKAECCGWAMDLDII